jgi:hypothetical protein
MLDLETKASYTVMVIATDKAGLTDEITVTITVTDDTTANNPPTFNAGSSVSYSIVEGASGRTVGAPLTATDSDTDDTLTYAIKPASDPDELFAIDPNGQLTTAKAVTPGTHELTVTVTDSKAADGTADTVVDAEIMVTITVTDVNEGPTFEAVAPVSYSIVEGASGRTVGAPLTATDSEPIAKLLMAPPTP